MPFLWKNTEMRNPKSGDSITGLFTPRNASGAGEPELLARFWRFDFLPALKREAFSSHFRKADSLDSPHKGSILITATANECQSLSKLGR
jgi:hypothetical protein